MFLFEREDENGMRDKSLRPRGVTEVFIFSTLSPHFPQITLPVHTSFDTTLEVGGVVPSSDGEVTVGPTLPPNFR